MINKEINKVLRTIPDFPSEGINFKDITPILLDYNLSHKIIDLFVDKLKDLKIDAIVGIESRGFLFGFLLANRLRVPFIPIRKVGKLPGETLKYKYDLEYGSAEVEIHKNDVKKDWNVIIHDDLLATGGTALAAVELIEKFKNKNIVGAGFIINLPDLKGDKKLQAKGINIHSLMEF